MTATSSELKRARATELWMIVEKWNWQWPLFKRDFKLWSSKTPRAKPVNEWMNPHFIEVCRVARCWAIEHLLERWKYHRPQSNSNCSNGSRGTSKTLLMVRVISYYHSHPTYEKFPHFPVYSFGERPHFFSHEKHCDRCVGCWTCSCLSSAWLCVLYSVKHFIFTLYTPLTMMTNQDEFPKVCHKL